MYGKTRLTQSRQAEICPNIPYGDIINNEGIHIVNDIAYFQQLDDTETPL